MPIFRLKAEQIDRAGEIATRAFQDDLLMTYLFPQTEQRCLCLQRFFKTIIYYSFLKHGFEAVNTLDIAAENLKMWSMVKH